MRWEKLAACCVAGGLLLAAGGCDPGGKQKQAPKQIEKGAKVEDTTAHHDHEHGPHDGHLIELGEHEYHAEIVFDAKAKKVVVYILGSDPKKAHPIDQNEIAMNLLIDEKRTPFKATAAPQEGDPAGKSSRFEIADNEDIAGDVESLEDLEGQFTVTIGGKPYSGDIAHDHGHDHGKGHEHDKAGAEKGHDDKKGEGDKKDEKGGK